MYWQLKNGLYDYDNLFEGIAKGDIDKIREESKVTYKSKNTGKRYFDCKPPIKYPLSLYL